MPQTGKVYEAVRGLYAFSVREHWGKGDLRAFGILAVIITLHR